MTAATAEAPASMAPVNGQETEVIVVDPPQGRRAGLLTTDASPFANLLDTARFEHMWRVSQLFARSTMVPQHYQGQPENCFIGIQMAVRLNVDPFMFLQNTYVTNGKPGMEGKLAIALVNSRGPFTGPVQWELRGQGDTRECTAYATDRKTGDRCEITVNIAMAKAEGWYGRNPKWKNLPDLMLRYRSGAWLARLYAPECLMGMQLVEEIEDIQPARQVASRTLGTSQSAPLNEQLAQRLMPHPADPALSIDTSTSNAPMPEQIDRESGEVFGGGGGGGGDAQPLGDVLAQAPPVPAPMPEPEPPAAPSPVEQVITLLAETWGVSDEAAHKHLTAHAKNIRRKPLDKLDEAELADIRVLIKRGDLKVTPASGK